MNADAYEPYDFANRRHIGPSPEEIAGMLQVVGVSSLDALIDETVPKDIRLGKALDFGRPLSERGALDRMRETANKNRVLTSLIGQGYHGTIMPPAIQRNILENPAWYTAYTPYQPEISQGRLEALLNFQTVVSDLLTFDKHSYNPHIAGRDVCWHGWGHEDEARSRGAGSAAPAGRAIAAAGVRPAEVARRAGVSRTSVGRWASTLAANGVRALRKAPAPDGRRR